MDDVNCGLPKVCPHPGVGRVNLFGLNRLGGPVCGIRCDEELLPVPLLTHRTTVRSRFPTVRKDPSVTDGLVPTPRSR